MQLNSCKPHNRAVRLTCACAASFLYIYLRARSSGLYFKGGSVSCCSAGMLASFDSASELQGQKRNPVPRPSLSSCPPFVCNTMWVGKRMHTIIRPIALGT